jgi:hypothetical protein
MIGQIWNALTRRPQSTHGTLGMQIEPIVKYRLALYVATSVNVPSLTTTRTGSPHARGLATPGSK